MKTACEKTLTITIKNPALSDKLKSELKKIFPIIAETIKITVKIINPKRKRFFNLSSFQDFSIINMTLMTTEMIIIKYDLS